jgi:hypothetical protein
LGEFRGVFAFALEFAEFRGEDVAAGLGGFKEGDGLAAAGVDGGEVAEDFCRFHSAGAQFFFYKGQVGPYKS